MCIKRKVDQRDKPQSTREKSRSTNTQHNVQQWGKNQSTTIEHKNVVEQWLHDIMNEYKLTPKWKRHTMYLLDTFLGDNIIHLKYVQLYTCICGYISMTMYTHLNWSLKCWLVLCDYAYTPCELFEALQNYIRITHCFVAESISINVVGKGNSYVHEMVPTVVKHFEHIQNDIPIQFFRELTGLRLVKGHKYASTFYGAWIDVDKSYIILQRYKCTLSDMITQNDDIPIPLIVQYMFQLLTIINYIHSQNFAHRDIKPSNIMITDDNILKLCDWDSSGYNTPLIKSTNPVCTLPYRPPECLRCSKDMIYDSFKIDIWSYGCIFLFMFLKTDPFQGRDTRSVLSSIEAFDSFPQELYDSIGTNGIDMLSNILCRDPKQRSTSSDILSHSFWTKYSDLGVN